MRTTEDLINTMPGALVRYHDARGNVSTVRVFGELEAIERLAAERVRDRGGRATIVEHDGPRAVTYKLHDGDYLQRRQMLKPSIEEATALAA